MFLRPDCRETAAHTCDKAPVPFRIVDELQKPAGQHLSDEKVHARDVNDLRRHFIVPDVSLRKVIRKSGHLVDLRLDCHELGRGRGNTHPA